MASAVGFASAKSSASMKALPKRKGNNHEYPTALDHPASMKALPKRKGNFPRILLGVSFHIRLNESPSEKEGKSVRPSASACPPFASMKALPKRKGNAYRCV